MRIIFMGTPDFSVPVLDALVDSGQEIAAVYCQPPRPAGRGKKDRPTPVHARAEALGLPVRHPVSLKSPEAQAAFAALQASGASRSCSGGSPCTRPCRPATETTAQLHDRLSALGAAAVVRALGQLDDLTPQVQPEDGVTYAHKIDKAEAALDWSADAVAVDRQIRGLSPFPGAWFDHDGVRIKVLGSRLATGQGAAGKVLDDALTVACGTGAVQLTRLQKAGRGAQDASEFLRGTALPAGSQL